MHGVKPLNEVEARGLRLPEEAMVIHKASAREGPRRLSQGQHGASQPWRANTAFCAAS